jgi:hypothetical protein
MRLPISCLALAAVLATASPADAIIKAVEVHTDVPFFTSDYGLAAGDVNGTEDLYFRRDGVSHLVSDGTSDSTYQFVNASKDGSTAFFYDDDGRLLVRSPAGLRQVAGAGAPYVGVDAVAPDGSRAFLETAVAFDPADADGKLDVYEYAVASGSFKLLSKGTSQDAFMSLMFPSGSSAVWSSVEKLTADDPDSADDFFVTGGNSVSRLSPGNGEHGAYIRALSQNSAKMVFETSEALSAADKDTEEDLYSSVGLAPTLLTPSPNAAADAKPVQFHGAAKATAGRVIFSTAERLTAGDVDNTHDVYASEDGALTLLTPGAGDVFASGISDDANVVLFSTASKLLNTDTDNEFDLYFSTGGALAQVLVTNGPFPVTYGRVSADGTMIYFETGEAVTKDDGDQSPDVYVRYDGAVQLASGRAPGAPAGADSEIELDKVLPSGVALFTTAEALLPADRNGSSDLYTFKHGELTMASADEFAPETTIETSGAGAFTSSLGATEQATFECRIDGAAWSACASPWTTGSLTPGAHVLQARAIDVAGNADQTPATRTVTVAAAESDPPRNESDPRRNESDPGDVIAPVLGSGKVRLRKRVPTLSFTLSEGAAVRVLVQRKAGRKWKTLRTKVLAGPAGANRHKLAKLPRRGTFRVLVSATDAAGNASTKLALRPSGR